MQDNNIKEMAILNEELKYSKKHNLLSVSNERKYLVKSQKLIYKYLKNNHLIKNEFSRKETYNIIKYLIKNKLNDVKKYSDIVFHKKITNSHQFQDLKDQISFPQKSAYMKIIFEKELISLEKKMSNLESNISKNNKEKLNFFRRKLKRYRDVKMMKLKIRIKDVKGFIRNKSIYKKVYLSDEPPLTKSGYIKLIFSYGFMILWAFIIIWPLFELVKATLNNNVTYSLNSSDFKFGFNSFERLFQKTDFSYWLTNTLLVAGITALATVFMSLLMGYAFSRFRFKGKRTSLLSVMLLQMVPTMASLTVFYVLFVILKKEFRFDGLTVLMLIYIGGGVAGNTFIMKGYMDSISREIDEAAKIDGLSQWRIFTRIMVPLTKPMIALVALWSFIGPFGDFILPGLLLSDSKEFTMAKGLNTLVSDPQNQDQGAFAAGSILIAVPISLLFIGLRKFLIGGITAGGVKG